MSSNNFKSWIISAFLFVSATLSISCSSSSLNRGINTTTPVPPIQSEDTSRHHIFLIHGLGGSSADFGHMTNALGSALNTASDDLHIINSFDYRPENDIMNFYSFARQFAGHINRYFVSEPLSTSDKVSVVMHAQGGLIGTVWLMGSLMGDPIYSSEIVPNIDSFITLNTSFWDPKSVHQANQMNDLLQQVSGFNLSDPMNRHQLEEMNFGSDSMYSFMQTLLSLDRNLLSDIRILNIAGVPNSRDALDPVLSNAQYAREAGISPPSSRLNFLYHDATSSPMDQLVTPVPSEIDVADFATVSNLEIAPVTATEPMPSDGPINVPSLSTGLVHIPSSCVTDHPCSHPIFPLLLGHISGTHPSVGSGSMASDEPRSFTVNINLRTTHTQRLQSDTCELTLMDRDGVSPVSSDLELGTMSEPLSRGAYARQEYAGHGRYHMAGNMVSSAPVSTIRVHIECDGMMSRDVIFDVRGGWTSYLDVTMPEASSVTP